MHLQYLICDSLNLLHFTLLCSSFFIKILFYTFSIGVYWRFCRNSACLINGILIQYFIRINLHLDFFYIVMPASPILIERCCAFWDSFGHVFEQTRYSHIRQKILITRFISFFVLNLAARRCALLPCDKVLVHPFVLFFVRLKLWNVPPWLLDTCCCVLLAVLGG